MSTQTHTHTHLKLLLVPPEGSRLLPDWMKTRVSVSMSLLDVCVWLLAMMSGADTTPAAMVTPVKHTEASSDSLHPSRNLTGAAVEPTHHQG